MKPIASQPSTIMRRPGSRTGRVRGRRALSGLLGLLLLPGLLIGTGTALAESEMAQQPLISSVAGEPNVVLMMDDSASMNQTWLPAPRDFNYASLYGPIGGSSWFNVPSNSAAVHPIHISEVQSYSPQINPLHYNPAVTYLPWNDNNKPAATNFPPARIGTAGPSGSITQGTESDPRYIQDGSSRFRASLSWSDRFTRSTGTRNTDVCTARGMAMVYVRCNATSPPVATPDGGSSSYCIDPVYEEREVCTAYEQAPALVPARYYRLEGSWAADRHDYRKYRMIEIDRAFPTRMYPTPVDPFTGVRVKRSDCTDPENCSFTEEAQNFANWYTYYRTRMFATIGVTSHVLSSLGTGLRMGYGRLNYFANAASPWPAYPSNAPGAALPDLDGVANPGHLIRGVREFAPGTEPRQEVFDWLFTLNGSGGTPNRESLDAAGRYYSRNDAKGPWSSRPGTGPGGGTADLSCRRSYTILATDGTWTDVDGSNHPRLSDRYSASGTPFEFDSVAGPVITAGGAESGKTYQYLPANEPALSTASSTSGTLADVAHYYWGTDLRPDLLNNNAPVPWASGVDTSYPSGYFDPSTWQNMRTMIIGYGLQPQFSASDVRTAMESGAPIAWPTVNHASATDIRKIDDSVRAAMASRGNFFSAMDTSSLTEALSAAFSEIGDARASSANLGISSAVIRSTDDLAFEASYVSGEWSGALTAVEALGLVSGSRTVRWTASLPASRTLVTASGVTAGVGFEWANLSTDQKTAVGDAKIIDYVRGSRDDEMPSGSLRQRASLFGTFVHSAPYYSKATNYGQHRGPTAGGTAYGAYLASKIATRDAVVMIGGNDGMLHAFDATTGVEKFGYVPRAVVPRLKDFASTEYSHFYLVDGQVSEGDVFLGGAWKTVVIGTGGAGPKSIFALDVTNPSSFGPGKVLFDLTEAEVSDLGHVMGRVLVASTKAGKWVAITGNGMESANERAVLLVIDLATGAVLKKIDTGVGSSAAGNRNGLGPVTPIYNANRDVVGIYAGDRLGNVWKFDLSSTNVADWKIAGSPAGPLYTAKDPAGKGQPITSEIRVTDHPAGGFYLAFGTGQYVGVNDVISRQVQSLIFLRDKADGVAITRASLKQATLSAAGSPGMLRLGGLSGPGGLDWSTHKGWYVDLKLTGQANLGERVIAAPVLSAGKVLFTSFKPTDSDPCAGGGSSALYTFDLASGMRSAVFDGEAPDVIGRVVEDGLPGGIVPLYVAPESGGAVLSSIGADQLTNLTGHPRHTVGPGGAVTSVGSGARCGAAGASIRAQALAVESACSGVMPLRTWRDMR